jgi:hypothetical protein
MHDFPPLADTHVCVATSLLTFNQSLHFHETWYTYRATRGHHLTLLFNFLLSIIAVW